MSRRFRSRRARTQHGVSGIALKTRRIQRTAIVCSCGTWVSTASRYRAYQTQHVSKRSGSDTPIGPQFDCGSRYTACASALRDSPCPHHYGAHCRRTEAAEPALAEPSAFIVRDPPRMVTGPSNHRFTRFADRQSATRRAAPRSSLAVSGAKAPSARLLSAPCVIDGSRTRSSRYWQF